MAWRNTILFRITQIQLVLMVSLVASTFFDHAKQNFVLETLVNLFMLNDNDLAFNGMYIIAPTISSELSEAELQSGMQNLWSLLLKPVTLVEVKNNCSRLYGNYITKYIRESKNGILYVILHPYSLQEIHNALKFLNSSFQESAQFMVIPFGNKTIQLTATSLAQEYHRFSQAPNFPGYVARIAFVFQEKVGLKKSQSFIAFGTICYLCKDTSGVWWSQFSLEKISLGSSEFLKTFQSEIQVLVKNGHASPANLHFYPSFQNLVEDFTVCERDLLYIKMSTKCFQPHVVTAILLATVNLTAVVKIPKEFSEQLEGPVKVAICVRCAFDGKQSSLSHIKSEFYQVDIIRLFYCEERIVAEEVHQITFIDCVDKRLIILLLLLSILLVIVNDNHVAAGLIVFYLFLLQGFPKMMISKSFKWKGLLPPVFSVVILSWAYCSVLTTDLTVPHSSNLISSCKELFSTGGFRYVMQNEDYLAVLNRTHGKRLRDHCGFKEFSKEYCVFDPILAKQLASLGSPEAFKRMAHLKATVIIWERHAKAFAEAQKDSSSYSFMCHAVRQDLGRRESFLQFKGFLKNRIAHVYHATWTSGILAMFDRKATTRLTFQSGLFKQKVGQKTSGLSLASPIRLIFYFWLVLLGFAMLSYFIETSVKWKEQWKN